jgi:hypothetical protein
MTGLTEKPDPVQARTLERRYSRGNLLLLEGRARLTAAFVDFARARTPSPGTEPKLALAIAADAASHPVRVVETSGDVIDLGALAASHPANAAFGPDTGITHVDSAMTTVAPGAQHLGG